MGRKKQNVFLVILLCTLGFTMNIIMSNTHHNIFNGLQKVILNLLLVFRNTLQMEINKCNCCEYNTNVIFNNRAG